MIYEFTLVLLCEDRSRRGEKLSLPVAVGRHNTAREGYDRRWWVSMMNRHLNSPLRRGIAVLLPEVVPFHCSVLRTVPLRVIHGAVPGTGQRLARRHAVVFGSGMQEQVMWPAPLFAGGDRCRPRPMMLAEAANWRPDVRSASTAPRRFDQVARAEPCGPGLGHDGSVIPLDGAPRRALRAGPDGQAGRGGRPGRRQHSEPVAAVGGDR